MLWTAIVYVFVLYVDDHTIWLWLIFYWCGSDNRDFDSYWAGIDPRASNLLVCLVIKSTKYVQSPQHELSEPEVTSVPDCVVNEIHWSGSDVRDYGGSWAGFDRRAYYLLVCLARKSTEPEVMPVSVVTIEPDVIPVQTYMVQVKK